MMNAYEEYLKLKEKEYELETEYDRDIALSTIPALLVPGPGLVISGILIVKRFNKFVKDIENI